MEEQHKRSMRQHCVLKHGIFKEFLAEFLGTFVLVLFGCGSVAQTVLSRNTLGEPLTVHIGFSVGLMMAAYVAGGVSDAFMDFTSGILSVTGINATAHIFASYPARHLSVLGGFIDQVVGTGMLVLCILAIIDGGNIGAPKGVEPLAIGLIIMAIGVSMGLNCGYPLNPARDLGPRLFTAVAGWGMDVFSTADYWWWIPVAGPMVGGVVAAVVYLLFIELHHPHDESEKQQEEEEEEEEEEDDEDSSLKDKYEMIAMS
ncbi:aquaporin-9-like isoform X2 [Leuresthes tenuis]|uniref:aquaporin-9-like isoform X2 n=1 Tax=Leuresthes tenuis TaxID=355514 RepID=UPI003B510520